MSFFTPRTALSFGLGAVLSAAPVAAQLFNQTIQTTLGPVEGFKYFNSSTTEKFWNISDSNVTAFLGIPYAATTGGDNRWKAPQPRASWNETLLATEFGAPCPLYNAKNYSEDCLSVNVWTSANSSSDKLAVVVWNQGSEETSDNTWWYGGGMAMKNVVTITFNRRDDVLGFLATPELNAEGLAETGFNTSGNYGVLDHLEVLKWVQNNIAAFGGDPDQVTVAGQSFGSSQVYHAVNSELFTGYFHGAISESGIRYPYDTMLAGLATSYVTMEDALANGLNYTETHNVSTIAELRALSIEDIIIGSYARDYSIWNITALSCMYPLIFKPVLDGYVLPKTYLQQLIDGPANDVPLITGNTKDESGAALSTNYTVAEYTEYCTLKFGNLSSEYFEIYPAGDNSTHASMAWNAMNRDISLVSSWAYANAWTLSANSSIYTYYWDHAPPGQAQGAFHQSEIMYALNALYANDEQYPFVSQDFAIAEAMSGYWANFIKTGDPNTGDSYAGEGDLATWYPNDGTANYVMELGDGFGNYTVSTDAGRSFIMEYFSQQVPY